MSEKLKKVFFLWNVCNVFERLAAWDYHILYWSCPCHLCGFILLAGAGSAPTICLISAYILSPYLYCFTGHPTWHHVGETERSESATWLTTPKEFLYLCYSFPALLSRVSLFFSRFSYFSHRKKLLSGLDLNLACLAISSS